MAKKQAAQIPQRTHTASVHKRARKRGPNAYEVVFRLDRQSKSRTFTTEKHAENWAEIVRREGPEHALKLLQGVDAKVTHQWRTFDEVVERYIETRSGVEPKTVEDYRLFLRTGISAAFGYMPLNVIDDKVLSDWMNAQEHRAPKTIKNRWGFIPSVFNYAAQRGMIAANPCHIVSIPKVQRKPPVFLLPSEFAQIAR
jgi:integrase